MIIGAFVLFVALAVTVGVMPALCIFMAVFFFASGLGVLGVLCGAIILIPFVYGMGMMGEKSEAEKEEVERLFTSGEEIYQARQRSE